MLLCDTELYFSVSYQTVDKVGAGDNLQHHIFFKMSFPLITAQYYG